MPAVEKGGKMEIISVGIEKFSLTWRTVHFNNYYFPFEEESHLLCVGSGESSVGEKERTFAVVLGKMGERLINSCSNLKMYVWCLGYT